MISALALALTLTAAGAPTAQGPWILTCNMTAQGEDQTGPNAHRRFRIGPQLFQAWNPAQQPPLYALDVHAEQLLYGLADLGAMGVLMDAEDVLTLRDEAVALLGHDGREQDLVRMQAHVALPCTTGSALSLTSSERAQTTCETSSSDGSVTTVLARLRNDFATDSSSSVTTR